MCDLLFNVRVLLWHWHRLVYSNRSIALSHTDTTRQDKWLEQNHTKKNAIMKEFTNGRFEKIKWQNQWENTRYKSIELNWITRNVQNENFQTFIDRILINSMSIWLINWTAERATSVLRFLFVRQKRIKNFEWLKC